MFGRRNLSSTWSPEMARADPQRPFVHLEIQTAYSDGGTSPSLPEDYVRALGRQHPLNTRTSEAGRIYLAIADHGLHSAVKTVAACARAGIEHIRASVGRQVATAFIDTAMEPLIMLDAVRRSIPDVELNPLAWAPS